MSNEISPPFKFQELVICNKLLSHRSFAFDSLDTYMVEKPVRLHRSKWESPSMETLSTEHEKNPKKSPWGTTVHFQQCDYTAEFYKALTVLIIILSTMKAWVSVTLI